MCDSVGYSLTATGYLCYLRSVHRVVAESRHIPWRNQLLSLSPAALSLLVLATFVSAMLIKVIHMVTGQLEKVAFHHSFEKTL